MGPEGSWSKDIACHFGSLSAPRVALSWQHQSSHNKFFQPLRVPHGSIWEVHIISKMALRNSHVSQLISRIGIQIPKYQATRRSMACQTRCTLARMRLVQETLKVLALQVTCDPTTRVINMAKKGAKKAAAEAPAPKKAMKATHIPTRVDSRKGRLLAF